MLDKVVWQPDRMLLGDLVFRLEHSKNDDWDLGDECFDFFKTQPLVDQYARFWSMRLDFAPRQVFELGIWAGGSLAFWFEVFHPAKLVGIDIKRNQTSRYMQRYIQQHGLQDRLKLYWDTNQSDAKKLRRIVASEFSGLLDLIIDDASHVHALTKASFETLFPLLRPGGLYIIEDWAWGHWREFRTPPHPWTHERPLTDLVRQFVEATGTATSPECAIANVTIFQGFTAVERGGLNLDDSGSFRLEDHIFP